ncbi:MAG: DUF3526 domain-containing protein [Gemmatimonadota bacterium]
MRGSLRRELWFLLRDRHATRTVFAALLLSVLAIGMGLREVEMQQREVASLSSSTLVDLEASLDGQPDPGSAAYYGFRLVFDPPSALAFAAQGVRDDMPWKHRLRLLALEGQIYESDPGNPELRQAGRLDYSFLIGMLAPLLVILLLYDLVGRERRQNRYHLLAATGGNAETVLYWRAGLRSAALALALVCPFVGAALWSGAPGPDVLLLAAVAVCHISFWAALTVGVTRRIDSAATSAAVLLGAWVVAALAVPVVAAAVAERQYPVPEGGEILLTQRETVNRAWDLPEEHTMVAFVASHPTWEEYAEVSETFEWKWYYAFQQVGDESVSEESEALRRGIRERDRFMGLASWVSPPLLVERAFSGRAETDIAAYQRYEACARDYHRYLREAHYPMIFGAEPYDMDALLDLEALRDCSVAD